MTAIEDAGPDCASITYEGRAETFRRGEVGYELVMQLAEARREIQQATVPPTNDEREAVARLAADRRIWHGNATDLEDADAYIAAGFRRQGRVTDEWEYGAVYQGDNGDEIKWFSRDGAFTVHGG